MLTLNAEEAAYFLKLFRKARYAALEDAENFREICFALEELGCRINGSNTRSLRKYSGVLRSFVHTRQRQEFTVLFNMVVDTRNEASHRGVFARNLSEKSIKLSLNLEEGLSSMTIKVKHLMSENVVFAQEFHSLAKIREIMLENSFSYIPICLSERYYFLSDTLVAKKWMTLASKDKEQYNTKVSNLFSLEELLIAEEILSEEPKSLAYSKIQHLPLLVVDGKHQSRKVIGILAPFDLL